MSIKIVKNNITTSDKPAVKKHISQVTRQYISQPPTRYVKIEKGEIGFYDGHGWGYWLDLERIPNHEALVGWIHHLLGKEWITNEALGQFIEVVCSYRDWKIYKGY